MELIRAVIQGIANFWMGIFPLPQSVLDRINASCRNFLWGKAEVGKKKTLVAWSNACSLKKEGGWVCSILRTGTLRSCPIFFGTFMLKRILFGSDGSINIILKEAVSGTLLVPL